MLITLAPRLTEQHREFIHRYLVDDRAVWGCDWVIVRTIDRHRIRGMESVPAGPTDRKENKTMSDKRMIEDYTPEEFEAVLNAFVEREIEDVPMDDFFAALAEIDRRRQEVIQVQGRIVQGQLVFSLPRFAPPTVAVEGNQIILDQTRRIVVTLEPATT